MKTKQMTDLCAAVTGRALTFDCGGEIPLESKIGVFREGYPSNIARYPHFVWATPKDEDNVMRSFITAFCSKYKEPDPETYFDYDGKPSFDRHAAEWNNPKTRHLSPCWHHHAGHMLSKDKLRAQVEAGFARMTPGQFSLCFYPANYGIGIFSLFGGRWIDESIAAMAQHLRANAIPFRNELSEKHWVTRFVIGATREAHAALLSGYKPEVA